MPKGLVEAFADGIFAFASTLLILNIVVDQLKPLTPQIFDNWTSYAAYALSFITIGIIGSNHHTVMNQIARVDRFFLLISTVFLMFIAFIPFPTRLLALDIRTSDAEAAALLYGVTLTCTSVMFNVLWRYAATGRRLLRQDADQRVVDGISRTYLLGPVSYGIATLVAIVSPVASAALYAAIALFYALESSVFGRSAAR